MTLYREDCNDAILHADLNKLKFFKKEDFKFPLCRLIVEVKKSKEE